MPTRRLLALAVIGAISGCGGGSDSDAAQTAATPTPTAPPAVATPTPTAPAAAATPTPTAAAPEPTATATATPAPGTDAPAQHTPAADPSAIPADAYFSASGTGPRSAEGVVFRDRTCLRYFVADRRASFTMTGQTDAFADVPGSANAPVELYTSGAGRLTKAHRAVWLPQALAPETWKVTLAAQRGGEAVRWTFSLTQSSRRDCRA
jgi:hypothetical protein